MPVFDLSAGQPSTPAPAPVRAAPRAALDADRIGYTNALGIPPLRAAIAGHYRAPVRPRRRPGNVVVTTGSSGGVPARVPGRVRRRRQGGDGPARLPRLPQHPGRAGLRGGRAAVRAETRFQPTVAQLDALRRAAGRAGARQPGQPDRHHARPGGARRADGWCDAHGTRLISDEIYHGITYGERRRRPPGRPTAARSSSTRSPSTSR